MGVHQRVHMSGNMVLTPPVYWVSLGKCLTFSGSQLPWPQNKGILWVNCKGLFQLSFQKITSIVNLYKTFYFSKYFRISDYLLLETSCRWLDLIPFSLPCRKEIRRDPGKGKDSPKVSQPTSDRAETGTQVPWLLPGLLCPTLPDGTKVQIWRKRETVRCWDVESNHPWERVPLASSKRQLVLTVLPERRRILFFFN